MPQPSQTHRPGGRPALDKQWLGYLEAHSSTPDPLTNPGDLAAIQQASELCNDDRFKESHEEWEALWRATRYPERLFYLAMAKLTAGLEQGRRGNGRGAHRLIADGSRYLAPFRPAYGRLDTERLAGDAQRCLAVLNGGGETDPLRLHHAPNEEGRPPTK